MLNVWDFGDNDSPSSEDEVLQEDVLSNTEETRSGKMRTGGPMMVDLDERKRGKAKSFIRRLLRRR